MKFDYKMQLLLQTIFPEQVTVYAVVETFSGKKPLREVITDYLCK